MLKEPELRGMLAMSTVFRPPSGTTCDPLYPDHDGKPMGETEYHILALTHLYSVLGPWFRRREGVHVAANMLLYYEQGNPSAVRGPDLMVSKGVRGKHFRRSFRTWEEGVAPTTIIEITSRGTKDEDQFEKPAVYARIGVKEYFLFDPLREYLLPRLQAFRLVDGAYVLQASGESERLTSEELGLDFVADAHLLRVVDPNTGRRLPTGEEYQEQLKLARREARKAQRQAAEARRQSAEIQRREAAARHAAADAQIEADIQRRRAAEFEAEIARLRGLPPPGNAPK
jgi:Uma2 family endonuclease